jgi:hypothetical protein
MPTCGGTCSACPMSKSHSHPPGPDRHPGGSDDAHGGQPPAGLCPQAGPRPGDVFGLLRHDGAGHDGLSPDRSVSGPAGPGRAVLLRAVDPPAGDVLVLSAADRDSAGQCPARLGGGTCQLRLPEQLLQSDPPVLAAWSRLLQAVPGSRLLLHAHAGSHRDRVRRFWPSKASRPSGWRLSTSCPRRNTSAFTSGSTWPWIHSPTAAAPRPVTLCGWECRW